jgi:hypothetical protein
MDPSPGPHRGAAVPGAAAAGGAPPPATRDGRRRQSRDAPDGSTAPVAGVQHASGKAASTIAPVAHLDHGLSTVYELQ